MIKPPQISANKVSIPLINLIEIAEIAAGKSRANVERNLQAIQEVFAYSGKDRPNKSFDAMLSARKLKVAAEDLEKSITILHALESAINRDELEITKEELI